ncbi:MAG: patatin-like phospholipase family protein [Phyllobacterium sp.]|uniref:patatin-like phospholipase family protein n=1 Tax=Phyllobacterium sp. TaxID=1871046 RepID=UPI0030F28030
MNEHVLTHRNPVSEHPQRSGRPPFERIALLLQGGGALGAYQAGVYQGLAEAGLHPDWTAGISIGAINAALIAGNPPEDRVAKLRQFWELVTSTDPYWQFPPSPTAEGNDNIATVLAQFDPSKGDVVRALSNQWSAARALCLGAPGFFMPRLLTPWLWPHGSTEATSYYDTQSLKSTLERLVDFDRINSGAMRFSVGAVNVRTGNFVYFDNTTHLIRPEHVMASGALPPGFPAIEIDGEHYWDGGLVSNTPLSWVVDNLPHRDTLAFQVDLWSAQGELPRKMAQIQARQKEIQYSSRTRAELNRFREIQFLRGALSRLIEKLPAELAASPDVDILRPASEPKVWNLVQLGYHSKKYEDDTKDYEFSRRSMEDHWQAGYHDTIRTLRHPEVLERPRSPDGVFTFDIVEQERA